MTGARISRPGSTTMSAAPRGRGVAIARRHREPPRTRPATAACGLGAVSRRLVEADRFDAIGRMVEHDRPGGGVRHPGLRRDDPRRMRARVVVVAAGGAVVVVVVGAVVVVVGAVVVVVRGRSGARSAGSDPATVASGCSHRRPAAPSERDTERARVLHQLTAASMAPRYGGRAARRLDHGACRVPCVMIAQVHRRAFLVRLAGVAGAAAVGPQLLRLGVGRKRPSSPGPGPYGALQAADANGLQLPGRVHQPADRHHRPGRRRDRLQLALRARRRRVLPGAGRRLGVRLELRGGQRRRAAPARCASHPTGRSRRPTGS